jgi:hypothetical protein
MGAIGHEGRPHGQWGGSRSQGNQGDQLGRVDNQEVGIDAREGGAHDRQGNVRDDASATTAMMATALRQRPQ